MRPDSKELYSDIFKIFRNEKIIHLFQNNDTNQGEIIFNFKRNLNFYEIEEINSNIEESLLSKILSKYENFESIHIFLNLIYNQTKENSSRFKEEDLKNYFIESVKKNSKKLNKRKFPTKIRIFKKNTNLFLK